MCFISTSKYLPPYQSPTCECKRNVSLTLEATGKRTYLLSTTSQTILTGLACLAHDIIRYNVEIDFDD